MTRRDISLTIALCASLTVHTLLLRGAADLYIKQIGRISLPGIPREQVLASTLLFPSQEDDPTHRLGDSTGKGDSTSQSPGDTPMQATKGPQNQPFLSVDPTSAGNVRDEPADSELPSEPAAEASPPQPQSETPAPFGLNTPADFSPPQVSKPQPPTPPAPQAPAAPAAPQSAANPAPQGDSDADPITTAGSVEFRRGSTNVRLGRNHKLTRPRLSLAAQADLLTLPSPIVVLKLKLDETGNVTSATIFRSSGSSSVDEPVKIAAYKWWFEPAKDPAGKPIKDVILFTVGFIERS